MGRLALILTAGFAVLTRNTLYCAIIAGLFALTWAGSTRKPRKQKYAAAPITCVDERGLEMARERFRTDARSMLREGYENYKGQPFYVPSPLGERLMIPGKYVEELKTAPVQDVDFVGTFYEMFEGKYTTMGSRSTLHPRAAKQQLNQYLEQTLKPVNEEIEESFDVHLPQFEDWTEVAVGDAMVQIVARVSSRMFGGTELSRCKEWVDATINFAVDGFIGAQKIKRYPTLIRSLAARWIPELSKIGSHQATAKKVIVPILERRDEVLPKSQDFLQWMVDSARNEEAEREFIASIQLKLSFAAIHTSAAAPTQMLYDLCARPEYVAPLREEIEEVLSVDGGLWTKHALRKLVKMDSFMKESQRFNPLLLITFERIVTKDLALKDGFFIPKGTTIGVPAQAISMDQSLFPDPDHFDGFRFSKMRASGSPDAARLVYAASNLDSMAFGYGRHACPGRHFADCEIKMIMAYLLTNYDFKFPDAVNARPESLLVETQCLPNHDAKILFKRRQETA